MGITIKDLQKGVPSKNQSIVHDGEEGTKRIEFAELFNAILNTADLNTAGFHNSIYRGKDITSYFNDGSLYDRIAGTNGFAPFEDLYIGDFIKMPRVVKVVGDDCDNAGTDIVKIAGFNCHWKNYWSGNMLTKPHIEIGRAHV